ncbi:hypothetical protein FJU30_16100 [Affinibrenneria salicis]|uniref:Alpha/beta hydrolase n=1 Tax=Affinibrenneria salicis TaxID=2590031 RepID=A0A5J5FX58_9GAMM|nr:hypothetical protein [Affinibrenneria salicis]KAA8998522.1 hypothetical protein FJU30_16100 [Affinibrenneria salicis]
MYIDEAKKFVLLHSKILGVYNETKEILERIKKHGEDSEDGWSTIFYKMANDCYIKGDFVKSGVFYNLARFPFPETEVQNRAYVNYLAIFDELYVKSGLLKRVEASDGKQIFYLKESSATDIVIITGGIISLKEQWVKLVKIFSALKITVVLAEMPGVGQNSLSYGKASFRMYSDILDVVCKDNENINCHLMALSFSGFIAYKNNLTDDRIKGITMVGTPLNALYHDKDIFDDLPKITQKTICYNIKKEIGNDGDIFDFMDENFHLTKDETTYSKIFYVQSLKDEIISCDEACFLKNLAKNSDVLSLNDEHGSPHYHKVVVSYCVWSVLNTLSKHKFIQILLKFFIFLKIKG